jgi:RNA-directed DNA polymerase
MGSVAGGRQQPRRARVDGVTIRAIQQQGVSGFLDELQAELVEGRYRPLLVRRVTNPKRQGGERHLGVPALRDRVVQAAWKVVCEPVFEAGFADVWYGFGPGRSARQARERIRAGLGKGRRWVVDADIKGFLDPASHCPLGAGEGVQQPPVGLGDLDTQAFSPSGADVDGA